MLYSQTQKIPNRHRLNFQQYAKVTVICWMEVSRITEDDGYEVEIYQLQDFRTVVENVVLTMLHANCYLCSIAGWMKSEIKKVVYIEEVCISRPTFVDNSSGANKHIQNYPLRHKNTLEYIFLLHFLTRQLVLTFISQPIGYLQNTYGIETGHMRSIRKF